MEIYDIELLSVKEWRVKKGLTQLQLAQKSGIKQSHISQVESGHIHITYYTAIPLASVFKCNATDLILGNEMWLLGLDHSQRATALKAIMENEELYIASKGLSRVEQLDYGDRDSFGRKRSKRGSAQKSAEAEQFKRDGFGIKRKVVTAEPDKGMTVKDFFKKDESTFEERLNELLKKGKQKND